MLQTEDITALRRPLRSTSGRSLAFSSEESFLRVPPFPGSALRRFVHVDSPSLSCEPAALADALRGHKVGGSYWAARPDLPTRYVLVRSDAALQAAERLYPSSTVVLWERGRVVPRVSERVPVCTGECDPWHMLSRADAVILEADDEVRTVAALLDVNRYVCDPSTGDVAPDSVDTLALVAQAFPSGGFEDPFTGEPMSAVRGIELCGFWRRLIDSNRGLAGGIGFAFWKQDHVGALLWDGSAPFRFFRNATAVRTKAAVAVWRSKASVAAEELDSRGVRLVDVEDGFLRSKGLGADCIPPLSVVVDRLGAHFDPSAPSELEELLQSADISEALIGRAHQLRNVIVAAGVGKYECGTEVLDRPAGSRRHILVPGQVEDDRAVILGGCGLVSNLELLARVRREAPDAYILYKPHPDVLAGHRRGAISDASCLAFADEIVGGLPITSLLAMVDEVHVNTSLAGFEALLRGKSVTTYGVPFYSGWGLTRDLGPVPSRRKTKRSLDELVAATLLLYPRYLDPQTGLPCPAEVVVARLSASGEHNPSLVVGMRRLQGKLMRGLRSLVE